VKARGAGRLRAAWRGGVKSEPTSVTLEWAEVTGPLE
jgi:hypothetical protein